MSERGEQKATEIAETVPTVNERTARIADRQHGVRGAVMLRAHTPHRHVIRPTPTANCATHYLIRACDDFAAERLPRWQTIDKRELE
jgi:hypothetical protein